MRHSRNILALVLLLLLQVFSFNAYACLFSVGPAATFSMPNCPSSPKEPARQVCDTFKTMGINAAVELDASIDGQALCTQGSESLAINVAFPILDRAFSHYPIDNPPPSAVIVHTAVLRI